MPLIVSRNPITNKSLEVPFSSEHEDEQTKDSVYKKIISIVSNFSLVWPLGLWRYDQGLVPKKINSEVKMKRLEATSDQIFLKHKS